jgi:hypothetical protein
MNMSIKKEIPKINGLNPRASPEHCSAASYGESGPNEIE